VRITREEFRGLLDDFIRCMDQPTIDGLNTYLVSRAAAAQGLKVVLSGLGGDELFGGYPSFSQIPKLLVWGRHLSMLADLSQSVQNMLRILAPSVVPPKAAGLFTHSKDVASAYLLRRALHLENELDALLDRSWWEEGLEKLSTTKALRESIAPLAAAGATSYSQVAALEACWYMRNQLLRDTDWSSMAHGLEVRVPYVDKVVIERLGSAIASSHPPRKRDLIACIPAGLYSAAGRRKTGFTTPVQNWLADEMRTSTWGLRGWAAQVHRQFRAGLRTARDQQLTALAA
jgi:asparagine synthase (glutamine-hydrolysing)